MLSSDWEFYHENSLRAATTSDFWKRVTGKEGVKKWWSFPYFYLWYFSKIWILILQLLSRTPSGFYVLYRAAILSFTLDLRFQGSPGAVCSCLWHLRPFLLYQFKSNIWVKITLFLISILSYPFIKITTRKTPQPFPFDSFSFKILWGSFF